MKPVQIVMATLILRDGEQEPYGVETFTAALVESTDPQPIVELGFPYHLIQDVQGNFSVVPNSLILSITDLAGVAPWPS